MTKLSLKRRVLSWLLSLVVIGIFLTQLEAVNAQMFRGDKFSIQSGQPTSFEPIVQADSLEGYISLSTDLIDYGEITPTNPIKRQLTILLGSVGSKSSTGSTGNYTSPTCSTFSTCPYSLYVFQDHPLTAEIDDKEEIIPDTTCDNGTCTEKRTASWVNPFTFGLGFSFNDIFYQQFPDASKNEPPATILSQKIMVKLNVNQNQKKGSYTNTITFWVIPKL